VGRGVGLSQEHARRRAVVALGAAAAPAVILFHAAILVEGGVGGIRDGKEQKVASRW
jgi:hypothetical protein